MTTDAFSLGFLSGVREDYGFQDDELPNVDVPVEFQDNYFEDPDLDRYLEIFEQNDPAVAILGDAYSEEETELLDDAISELKEEYPYKELIAVPKCGEAFDVHSDDVTLGYPLGFSDLEPEDYSDLSDWRGRRVHILGGAPDKQYRAIQNLTGPVLTGDPPADITGVDWNGAHKIAYLGEYWSRDGWQPADHLSIRETVRKSLEEIKAFWEEKDLWPDTEPVELYGEPTEEPDELIWMDDGGDPIGSHEDLEEAYIGRYEDRGKMAFQSEVEKKFIEYREGLTRV